MNNLITFFSKLNAVEIYIEIQTESYTSKKSEIKSEVESKIDYKAPTIELDVQGTYSGNFKKEIWSEINRYGKYRVKFKPKKTDIDDIKKFMNEKNLFNIHDIVSIFEIVQSGRGRDLDEYTITHQLTKRNYLEEIEEVIATLEFEGEYLVHSLSLKVNAELIRKHIEKAKIYKRLDIKVKF